MPTMPARQSPSILTFLLPFSLDPASLTPSVCEQAGAGSFSHYCVNHEKPCTLHNLSPDGSGMTKTLAVLKPVPSEASDPTLPTSPPLYWTPAVSAFYSQTFLQANRVSHLW